jgi:hypothetical protein
MKSKRIVLLSVLLCVLIFCTGFANNGVIVVTNNAELKRAILDADSGELIKLAYSKIPYTLKWYSKEKKAYDASVTITSLNNASPAVLSALTITNIENVIIKNLKFVAEPLGLLKSSPLLLVVNSKKIVVENCFFKGPALSFASDISQFQNGTGVLARSVTDFRFENNEISHLAFGISIFGALHDSLNKNIIIRNNKVHHIQGDSVRIVQASNVILENNSIYSLLGASNDVNHTDMIQFWTTNTNKPTTNVIIRGNYLHSGNKAVAQSIFMRNELVDKGLASKEMYYKNILIENNIIYSSHTHGITVGETVSLNIKNNTVLYNYIENNNTSAPTINISENSVNVVVSKNIVTNKGRFAEIYKDNLFIQRSYPNQSNYYANYFVNSLIGPSASRSDLQAKPNSVIENEGWGASGTKIARATVDLIPRAIVTLVKYPYVFELDGGYSTFRNGYTSSNAFYTWTLEDGRIEQKQKPLLEFQRAGRHLIKLHVKIGNQESVKYIKIIIDDPLLFNLQIDKNKISDASSYNTHIVSNVKNIDIGQGTYSYLLNKENSIKIDKNTINIFNRKELGFEFWIKSTNKISKIGELFTIHKSLKINVLANGEVESRFTNENNEEFHLKSNGINIHNGSWHNIVVSYSSIEGVAFLFVDGNKVSEVPVWGLTKSKEYWNPTIGTVFKSAFNGYIAYAKIHGMAINKKEALNNYNEYVNAQNDFKK